MRAGRGGQDPAGPSCRGRRGRYRDGAVAVDLAGARPDAVAAAVASALRLTEWVSGGPIGRIVEVLAVREQLLVLDDCEHVAAAVAVLVEAVASGALAWTSWSREP